MRLGVRQADVPMSDALTTAAPYMQALKRAMENDGKRIYFSESATEEEIVLAELPCHNQYTAAQMISYAYTNALQFDTLLKQCSHPDTVLKVCCGVDRRVAESMAAEIQQALDVLCAPTLPAADDAATPNGGTCIPPLLGARQAVDGQRIPQSYSAGRQADVNSGDESQTRAGDRWHQPAAIPEQSQHKMQNPQKQSWPRPAVLTQHHLGTAASAPRCTEGALGFTAQLTADTGKVEQTMHTPKTKLRPHALSQGDATACKGPRRSPLELDREWNASRELTQVQKHREASHRGAGARKRPFSSLKDVTVKVDESLRPPEVGIFPTWHRCVDQAALHDTRFEHMHKDQEAGSPSQIDHTPHPTVPTGGDCGMDPCHVSVTPCQHVLATGPRDPESLSFTKCNGTEIAYRLQSVGLENFEGADAVDTAVDSDTSVEDNDLESLLQMQGRTTRCNRVVWQVSYFTNAAMSPAWRKDLL